MTQGIPISHLLSSMLWTLQRTFCNGKELCLGDLRHVLECHCPSDVPGFEHLTDEDWGKVLDEVNDMAEQYGDHCRGPFYDRCYADGGPYD
jgi:hypothetical protein